MRPSYGLLNLELLLQRGLWPSTLSLKAACRMKPSSTCLGSNMHTYMLLHRRLALCSDYQQCVEQRIAERAHLAFLSANTIVNSVDNHVLPHQIYYLHSTAAINSMQASAVTSLCSTDSLSNPAVQALMPSHWRAYSGFSGCKVNGSLLLLSIYIF